EEALGIPSARLAVERQKEGRVLLMLEEGTEIVAAAVFDPAFPGLYPFQARRPESAFALLHAARPHARQADAYVDLVVDDAPSLLEALARAGAETKLVIEHMSGPLPPAEPS